MSTTLPTVYFKGYRLGDFVSKADEGTLRHDAVRLEGSLGGRTAASIAQDGPNAFMEYQFEVSIKRLSSETDVRDFWSRLRRFPQTLIDAIAPRYSVGVGQTGPLTFVRDEDGLQFEHPDKTSTSAPTSGSVGSQSIALTSLPDTWSVHDYLLIIHGTNPDDYFEVVEIESIEPVANTVTVTMTREIIFPAGSTILRADYHVPGASLQNEPTVRLSGGNSVGDLFVKEIPFTFSAPGAPVVGGTVATIYYVDPTHPSANNGHPGTDPSLPWASLAPLASASSIDPGDRVRVTRGHTLGSVTIANNSGTAALPIVIEPTGIGTDPVIDGTGSGTGVHFDGVSYVTIQGFEIQDWATGVHADGCTGVEVNACEIHDCGTNVSVENSNSGVVRDSEIHTATQDGILVSGTSTGNSFLRVESRDNGRDGIRFSGSSAEENTVTAGDYHDNTGDGVATHGTNTVTVATVTSRMNTAEGFATHDSAVMVGTDCIAHGNDNGVHLMNTVGTSTFDRCWIYDNTDWGVLYNFGSGGITGIARFRNCIVVNPEPTVSLGGGGVAVDEGAYVEILNCLLYNENTNNAKATISIACRKNIGAADPTVRFINCAFFNNGATLDYYVAVDAASTNIVAATNNVYDGTIAGNWWLEALVGGPPPTSYSFAGWQALTDISSNDVDENSVNGDVVLVGDPSANTDNAKPQATSSQLSAGVNLSDELTDDFGGNTRPTTGSWTAGPWEHTP